MRGSGSAAAATPCSQCPLLGCEGLRPLDPDQISFMEVFKQGEVQLERGGQLLVQGRRSDHLYTILAGVLMRYRLLEDGRRQILNFMFPGDLVGLQGAFDEEVAHGVEAVIPARLCVFQRERFFELATTLPRLSFELTWLAAQEEAALEDHLVSLGQRNARERIANLAVFLVQRGMDTGMATDGVLALPITQTQIADMLGLSLVHTNRSLQTLRRSGLIAWTPNEIRIPDIAAARDFAQAEAPQLRPRVFI
ncbi:Crp/Fnr family transcriptional regulator [Novosphingobium lentum]|uniref:Crp/Fnr family transcriptional regulator n=1 Tax=Novosphingobium lentum TaxID=145287 RepID=UPI0009FE3F69|nr:Crp/Fnr family transcriptional regulator [Novosphingobium lentum]